MAVAVEVAAPDAAAAHRPAHGRCGRGGHGRIGEVNAEDTAPTVTCVTGREVIGAGAADTTLEESEIRAIVAAHADRLALDGQRLLVLIPDGTRTAPLPLLVDALTAAFASRVSALDLLIASGTHPPMAPDAVTALVGQAPGVVHQHDWSQPGTFVTLGVIDETEVAALSRGMMRESVPVRINRLVLDYDHLVVCGPVFPHEVVGFSGGNKYFFPGVSGPELIDLSHWLGALITSYEIIGTRGITPVRALIDRAARLIPTPRSALCFVVALESGRLHGLYAGPVEQAWAAAADLSAAVHIKDVDRAYHTVVSVVPTMYDDIWVAAKGMYKLEPVVADGGELILYAPHVREFSVTHGALIRRIGYHCRDYFLRQWDRFADVPRGVLAHSTHLTGVGTYDPATGIERTRITVTLATGISEQECRAVGLGYRDPATIDLNRYAGREAEGVLLVPRAGELLYRLRTSA